MIERFTGHLSKENIKDGGMFKTEKKLLFVL